MKKCLGNNSLKFVFPLQENLHLHFFCVKFKKIVYWTFFLTSHYFLKYCFDWFRKCSILSIRFAGLSVIKVPFFYHFLVFKPIFDLNQVGLSSSAEQFQTNLFKASYLKVSEMASLFPLAICEPSHMHFPRKCNSLHFCRPWGLHPSFPHQFNHLSCLWVLSPAASAAAAALSFNWKNPHTW